LSGSKTEKVFKMDQRNGTLREVEEGRVREGQAIAVLESFLGCLADGDFEGAYALVAPSSKEAGDPIAYNAPLDYESFVKELTPPSIKTIGEGHDEPTNADVRQKFVGYELGVSRWETPTRFRIWVTFQKWDKDEVTLVREGDSWYVADPIHIIR
jgi:hypothetical protein